MKQAKRTAADDEILPEYDFSAGVRGKYFRQYQQGTNIVLLDADVQDAFPDSLAVNEALRLLVRLAQQRVRPATKAETPSRRRAGRSRAAVRSGRT